MTVHWTMRLYCSECNSEITYVDERPDWQVDAERHNQNSVAERWMCAYQGVTSENQRLRLLDHRPKLIEGIHPILPSLSTPWIDHQATHYIACPACDARVYRDQHAEDADAEDETQAVS